ncbi:MAG: helix-turn-helix transcriptional regulator [Clostridia bacterium]|nr:helix-turn-helix transcriptional regulator [Clostridia bacterium]
MVRLKLKEYLDLIGTTRYDLSVKSGIQYQIIDKYYKNKVVRYDSYVLDRICYTLDCDISDIIEYKKDKA